MLSTTVIVGAVVTTVLLLRHDLPNTEGSHGLPRDRSRPVVYAALGDSTVAGAGASSPEKHYVGLLFARLRALYPQAKLMNLGVGGATSADVVRGQLQRAVALKPDLVTLSIGPNDITQGSDVQSYERNLETIFRTLSTQTHAVVVVNLLPDLAVAPRLSPEAKVAAGRITVQFNEALRRKARQYGVEVVDLYTVSQQEVPTHPEYVSSDQYHPSDVGYARWAELTWPVIEAKIP